MDEWTSALGAHQESLSELCRQTSAAQLECLEQLSLWDKMVDLSQKPIAFELQGEQTEHRNPLDLWQDTDWIVRLLLIFLLANLFSHLHIDLWNKSTHSLSKIIISKYDPSAHYAR